MTLNGYVSEFECELELLFRSLCLGLWLFLSVCSDVFEFVAVWMAVSFFECVCVCVFSNVNELVVWFVAENL